MNIMKQFLLYLFALFGVIYFVDGACTFPSALQGTWDSPRHDQVNITSNQMTGFVVDSYLNLTFTCEIRSSGRYILKSDDFKLLTNDVYALLCLKFTQQSSNVYTYFELTSPLADANYQRVLYRDATITSFTASEVCDAESVENIPQEVKLLVREGTASSEAIQCPSVILGKYWYVNGTNCSASALDVCTDLTSLTFNYTLCPTQLAYSAGGVLNCMYYVNDGTQVVLYVYNNDAIVDAANGTYQYSCLVLDANTDDGYIFVTQNPRECQTNQTAFYVITDGMDYTLSANETCIPQNSTSSAAQTAVSNAGVIAGVTVVLLALIAAGGAALAFFLCKKKKVTPTPTSSSTAKQPIEKQPDPGLLQEIDGRETITPSAMSAHIQSRNGSHGKLKQVLGKEFTMTDETRQKSNEAGTSTEMSTDDKKLEMGTNVKVMDFEMSEEEKSPRKLPPITEKPTSPLDTQLQEPLPPITMN